MGVEAAAAARDRRGGIAVWVGGRVSEARCVGDGLRSLALARAMLVKTRPLSASQHHGSQTRYARCGDRSYLIWC